MLKGESKNDGCTKFKKCVDEMDEICVKQRRIEACRRGHNLAVNDEYYTSNVLKEKILVLY